MKTKTNLKAGDRVTYSEFVITKTVDAATPKLAVNHNETLVRDCGKSLKIKTALRAGKKAK